MFGARLEENSCQHDKLYMAYMQHWARQRETYISFVAIDTIFETIIASVVTTCATLFTAWAAVRVGD